MVWSINFISIWSKHGKKCHSYCALYNNDGGGWVKQIPERGITDVGKKTVSNDGNITLRWKCFEIIIFTFRLMRFSINFKMRSLKSSCTKRWIIRGDNVGYVRQVTLFMILAMAQFGFCYYHFCVFYNMAK